MGQVILRLKNSFDDIHVYICTFQNNIKVFLFIINHLLRDEARKGCSFMNPCNVPYT